MLSVITPQNRRDGATLPVLPIARAGAKAGRPRAGAEDLVEIRPVTTPADLKAFIDLPYRLYANDPNWVPPLKSEVKGMLTPDKNPWFEHGEAQYFLAITDGRVTGRISAHIDFLATAQPPEQGMGPGTGFWGWFEAGDEASATALIAEAETWLRGKGMTKSMGPASFSYWDEIGLLVEGFDNPPTVMMAFNTASYQSWVEAAGYAGVQDLFTYNVPIIEGFPEIVNRVVASGERNPRIRIRQVDRSKFDVEAAIIIGILNDAWSDNWGFVPFTEREIEYAGKKLKPLIFNDLVRIAEVEGEPVAFLISIPDMNEQLIGFGGNLLPLNWAKLLWWLRKPNSRTVRVPLMGVLKKYQSTRLASQLALMLIEFIRRDIVPKYGTQWGDFGWVLSSNGPMRSVGEAVGGKINKVYRIYEKAL
jgi:GNAT superfamily N-acetyltransferase